MNCTVCQTPGSPHEIIEGKCHRCTAVALAAEMLSHFRSVQEEREHCVNESQKAAQLQMECAAIRNAVFDALPTFGAWESRCPFCGVGAEVGEPKHKPSCPVTMANQADAGKGWVSPAESADFVKKQMDAARLATLREAVQTIRLRITNPNALTERDCGLADAAFAVEDLIVTKYGGEETKIG